MANVVSSSKRTLPSDASHAPKKRCDDKPCAFNGLKSWSNYRVVWYGEQVVDYSKVTSKFRRGIADYLECFSSLDKSSEYIRSVSCSRPSIIVIVSVLSSQCLQWIDEMTALESVASVYIHQGSSEDDVHHDDNGKVRGSYRDLDELLRIVSREVLVATSENFVSASSGNLTGGASVEERTTCLRPCSSDDYFFNFLDSLLETEASSNGKRVFIEECRRLFADRQSILNAIDEFDRTYAADRAVYWYTRNGFLYSLVNQALRQRNTEALLVLHFFIRDLDLQLLNALDRDAEEEWASELCLYRGQRMSTDEIAQIQAIYQRGLFYSFLSTTKDIEVARMFSGAGQITKDEPVQPVLFQFECSMLKRLRGVANIHDESTFEAEEEILFSPMYSFSVREMKYDEDEQVWEVMCSMHGEDTSLPLVLHQRLIKLEIVIHVLRTTASSDDDADKQAVRAFTDGMSVLLSELDITEGNVVTLDKNAQVPTNVRNAVTALFFLRELHQFNADTLSHTPHISDDAMVALWDCLGTMCKGTAQFQRALNYFEKANTYSVGSTAVMVARKISIAQVHKMMGQHADAWSVYQTLLRQDVNNPAEDNLNVFYEIAVDMPDVKAESDMNVWYPNIFDYLEYVRDRCQESSANMLLFREDLRARYRSLGHGYWYLARDTDRARVCYERWRELLDDEDHSQGEVYMFMAHTYFSEDPSRARSLYERAIVELSVSEEAWSVELAVCFSRLGCLQRRKRFFVRCFYLLKYVKELAALRRDNLEEVAECYLCLAKYYNESDVASERITARELCEQALRFFLHVKPPTSNFREMRECATLLVASQNDTESRTEKDVLQRIYSETPITEEQLGQKLGHTLSMLNNLEIITGTTPDESVESELSEDE